MDRAAAPPSPADTRNAHKISKERQRAAKRVAAIETEVETLEARLVAIEAGLSAPDSADQFTRLDQQAGLLLHLPDERRGVVLTRARGQ